MKTLAEWVRAQPLDRKDAVGWAVRIVKALLVVHEADAPHGRINARSVLVGAPSCEADGALLVGDEVPKDVQFYSVRRIKLSGASKEDDVWALGVLLYFMVTGAHPYPGSHRRQVRERIEWRPASPIAVYGLDDPPLQALLDRIFKRDEALRLVAPKLLLRALLRLEPDAKGLPELERLTPEVLGVEMAEGEAPATDVMASVPALIGSADGSSSPLTEGALPRGPMATLPQMALSTEERRAVEAAVAQAPSSARPERRPSEGAAPASMGSPDPEGRAALVEERRATGEGVAEAPAGRASTTARDEPAPRRRRGSEKMLWGLVVALVGLAVALRFVPGLRRSIIELFTDRSLAGSSVGGAPSVAPPPTASSRTDLGAGDAGMPVPVASQKVGPALGTRDACVSALFPEDSFLGSTPHFDFLCTERDPRKVADAMRVEIVLGKGTRTVTEAMRTWSELGWYGLALVATARVRCCGEELPALESELGGPPCRFDDSLADLAHAVVHGDDDHLDKALVDYAGAINCLADAPTDQVFGFADPAGGEERALFREVIAPARPPRPAP